MKTKTKQSALSIAMLAFGVLFAASTLNAKPNFHLTKSVQPILGYNAPYGTFTIPGNGQGDEAITAAEAKVPAEVMDEFKSTFVFDEDGHFRGARIDMLRPYLSSEEIIDLLEPHVAGKNVLYEGYKPKTPRGCKKNNRWICVLRDIDILH